MSKKIRVLVVDGSALILDILRQGLGADPRIEVVGVAGDPYQAQDKILKSRPDVLTLAVEMSRMDGVDFLRRLRPRYPLPVIMLSAMTEQGRQITLDALEAGAVDFVTKPKAYKARGLNAMVDELRAKVCAASTANLGGMTPWAAPPVDPAGSVQRLAAQGPAESRDKIVAIGASTGGTEAIRDVVTRFPTAFPGTVIVQHMPSGFTQTFARRLDALCAMNVKEAEDKDRIRPGRILIAPGGMHLRVQRFRGAYLVRVQGGGLVNGHCPSVEPLFDSVAKEVGANAVGVMLTGMGADGAEAMRRMREAGARCFAQDEASSLVFGMPSEAHARGGAERLVPLADMAEVIAAAVSGTG